ncbi:MAG: outer membrane protein assembly factor BamE domain-containing protein [Planctomycetota bacterium]
MRSIPLTTLILAACSLPKIGGGDALSYAQVQSLREGMSIEEVVRQLGKPIDTKKVDGKTRALAYRAENARGEVEELRIAFDDNGLVRWTLAPRK